MLFRKMLRDLREHRVQFIAIFLMIFLGVFIYAGVNSEWHGLQVYSNAYYEETHMADIWMMGKTFTRDDVDKLRKNPQVIDAELRSAIPTAVTGYDKTLTLYMVDDNRISSMYTVEGEGYDKDKKGIWLDASYAKENNIEVGDTMTLSLQGHKITWKILGLVLHPENVYPLAQGDLLPDHQDKGFAILSYKAMPKDMTIPWTQILIRSNHPDKVEKQVCHIPQNTSLQCLFREDMPGYVMLRDEISQHKAFGSIFPIVFLLVAILTTMTTLRKLIISQRQVIGILKAVGFRNRSVWVHYLSYSSIIALAGAVSGYLVGITVLPQLIFTAMKQLYILPELQAYTTLSGITLLIFSILSCIATGYLVCRKQLTQHAARILRPVSIEQGSSTLFPMKFLSHCSFYTQWNVRDILRNKIRSLMAIVGIAGCMGLMYCAFGLYDTVNRMMNMTFTTLQTYDMKVELEPDADISKIKNRISGEGVMEGAAELKLDKDIRAVSMNVQEGTSFRKLEEARDLSVIDVPREGIALSYNLANQYDLQPQDILTWRMAGSDTWHNSRITVIVHTPSSQGITLSAQELKKNGYSFTPTALLAHKADVSDLSGIQSVQYKEDLRKSMDTMMESMNLMIFILIFGAVVLGVVVLYNLGTFSYYEKTREMATLKVLGFRNSLVRRLLYQQNLWLTIIGILAGIPFGYALVYIVITMVGETMDLVIHVTPVTYALCILGTLGLSMVVMIMVSSRLKKLDMVSALKSVE